MGYLMPQSLRFPASSQAVPVENAGDEEKSKPIGSHCQPIIDPQDWITKAEAARIRGVTRQAIAKLVNKGKLSTLKIAGGTLVKRAEVESFQPETGGRPTRP